MSGVLAQCGQAPSRCRHPVHCPHCGDGWESIDLVKQVRDDGDADELHCLACGGTFTVKVSVSYAVEKALPPREEAAACPCEGEEDIPWPHVDSCPFSDPNYDPEGGD